MELNSTSIKSVEHDAQAKVLSVRFHKGGVWHYDGVEGKTYRELLAAPSAGAHYHRFIRGKYPHRQGE